MTADLGGAVLIFLLRTADVSLGTLRVLHMVRGQRLSAALLGFVEASLFIIAITTVFKGLANPWNMLGYAGGFATGTAVGITLERWIASGYILMRAISHAKSAELTVVLRQMNFGVTVLRGEGREGESLVLFIVAPRRRGHELLKLTRQVDPETFITVEPLHAAFGGYVPGAASLSAVRK